jgi:hypothetical protein
LLSYSLVYLEFELRKEYIVNNICVEKEFEVNNCKGSCHVMRMIEWTETQNEQSQEKEVIPFNFIFYLISIPEYSLNPFNETEKKSTRELNNIYSHLLVHYIFQPPRY